MKNSLKETATPQSYGTKLRMPKNVFPPFSPADVTPTVSEDESDESRQSNRDPDGGSEERMKPGDRQRRFDYLSQAQPSPVDPSKFRRPPPVGNLDAGI
jgi:hypothetical protein